MTYNKACRQSASCHDFILTMQLTEHLVLVSGKEGNSMFISMLKKHKYPGSKWTVLMSIRSCCLHHNFCVIYTYRNTKLARNYPVLEIANRVRCVGCNWCIYAISDVHLIQNQFHFQLDFYIFQVQNLLKYAAAPTPFIIFNQWLKVTQVKMNIKQCPMYFITVKSLTVFPFAAEAKLTGAVT